MHIVVTGGLGFIGSNFIRQTLSANDLFITNIDAETYAAGLDNLKDIEGKKITGTLKEIFRTMIL